MPAQRRHARLKDSCDHCSNAKVRCTKEKPSCSRCHQRDLPCEYSYSRRAGRRDTSRIEMVETPSPVDRCTSPSASSSFGDSEETPSSPESMGDVMGSPLTFVAPPSYSWEQGLYKAQRNFLEQSTDEVPTTRHFRSTLADPSMPTLNSGFEMPPQAFQAHAMVRNPSTTSTGSMSSEYYAFSDYSNSSTQSHTEAVQDELSNLTNCAESMERKFDAVVRSRLQSRDIFSEFGTPLCDLELEDGSIPTPDTSELALYYSLAELKRRLKWVSEDVGNMLSNPF